MGGYLGSVGNGFQNQENLTNEAGVAGGAEDPYTRGVDATQSPFYSGTALTGFPSELQGGAWPIPFFLPVVDMNPTTYSELKDTLWRNSITASANQMSGLGYIADATNAGATCDVFFIGRDVLATNEVFKFSIGTFTKVDDEVGTTDIIYHAQLNAARNDLQTFSAGQTTVDYAVTSVNQGTKTVQFTAVTSVSFGIGSQFEWINSTGNDGFYTVASSSWNSGTLTIVTVEAIPDATVDGDGRRVGGVLVKDTDIMVSSCGQTDGCVFADGGYIGGGSFYPNTPITQYNKNVIRVDSWGNGAFKCQVEVLPTSRQPKGTMQIRWAGPSAENSLIFIFKHHDTGEIYTKVIARTGSNISGSPNLAGSSNIDASPEELNVQAAVGEDTVDTQYEIQFTSPTILS